MYHDNVRNVGNEARWESRDRPNRALNDQSDKFEEYLETEQNIHGEYNSSL